MGWSDKPSIRAGALSFLVYLIPLATSHTIVLLGQMIYIEATRSYGDRPPLWVAADVTAAVLLQGAAFVVLWWFFRKPRLWRGALVLCSVPVFVAVAHFALLLAIPTRFLIEADTSQEVGQWPQVCSADGVSLAMVRTAPHAERGSELLVQTSDGSFGLLHVPDCAVTSLPLPRPTLQPGGRVDFMLGVTDLAPGPSLLFHTDEPATGKRTWAVLRNGVTSPIPIAAKSVTPILSDDGRWIGWLEGIPETGPPLLERAVVRSIGGSPGERHIDLTPFGPALYVLIEIDAEKEAIVVSKNDAEQLTVGFDGRYRARSPASKALGIGLQAFRRVGNGWLAWSPYEDRDASHVRWSLPKGTGRHRVPKGRSINSVAVNASGDFIATSVSTSLNIGNIRDAIYVLRVSDGVEVFRRYLPTYSRTVVAFPGNDLLAYSAGGQTILVRVP